MASFGILTLYYQNDNYGGIAQAYALQKYIELLGQDAKLICYQRTSPPMRTGSSIMNYVGKKLHRAPEKVWQRLENKLAACKWKNSLQASLAVRRDAFARSRSMLPHTETVYTDETIHETAADFDCFISGSDQIWKPGVIRPPFVCSFLPDGKACFSYASSITVEALPEEYGRFMKKELEKFQWISVRERSAQAYLQALLDRQVDLVVDPTLLLNLSDWEELASPNRMRETYVFVYLLGQSREQREHIRAYAKALNWKIVFLPHVEGKVRACDIGFGDIHLYDVDLKDFLGLIKNAEMVFTDSFHAVVFSIIFQKKFWVYERQVLQLNAEMGSRLDTLLEYAGLSGRKISQSGLGNELNADIDYRAVYDRLNPEIERSRSLLQHAVQIQKRG